MRMEFKIFGMDGYDLYWVDGLERSDLMEFDTLEDALWAQIVWENFLRGEPGEPVLNVLPNGSVEILLER